MLKIYFVLIFFFISPLAAKQVSSQNSVQKIRTSDRIYDPLEGFNRGMFKFNTVFDTFVFNPIISSTEVLLPPPVISGVRNVFNNLNDVASCVNYLFQGKGRSSGRSLMRFLVNSIFGVAGLFDVATAIGIQQERTGFNFTLRSWGVKPGMYFVWPILGPVSTRDGVGIMVDFFFDPVNVYHWASGPNRFFNVKTIVSMVQEKEKYWNELWELKKQALDPYALERSIYYQKRDLLYELDEGPELLE